MTRATPSRAPEFVRPTFEELYLSARAWLPDALRRLGVRGDVEDILHDVVIIAHRRLQHFDPCQARQEEPQDPALLLRAWILGIARHRVIKRYEAASRRAALPSLIRGSQPSDVREAPNIEQTAADNERRSIVLRVLKRIPPRRAEVLILHTALEMSAPEIARELKLNENTVKSRIARGRYDALRAIERLPREHRGALHDLDDDTECIGCGLRRRALRRARDGQPRSPMLATGARARNPAEHGLRKERTP